MTEFDPHSPIMPRLDRDILNEDEWRWANAHDNRKLPELLAKCPPERRHEEVGLAGNTQVPVKVKRLHPDAKLPQYAHEGDAGADLCAVEDVVIEPGATVKVPLGLAFELPQGYEIQIRMRSGIAAKTKLRLPNGVGTIDAGFRGEVSMLFDNIAGRENGSTPRLRNLKGKTEYYDGTFYPKFTYIIRKGDRVCQAVLSRVPQAHFTEVGELGETERGDGGFGSTGVTGEQYASDCITRSYS